MTADGVEIRRARLRAPLRLHIAVLFVVLIALIGTALGYVASRSTRALVDDAVDASFAGSAELALRELRRLEATARAAAEAIAAHPIVEADGIETRAARLTSLSTVLRAVPGISAAYVGWPDGDFVLVRPVAGRGVAIDAPEGAVWLAQWAGPDLSRFDYLDDEMRLVARRYPAEFTFDPRVRPWFEAAAMSDQTVLTAPYVFFTTREPGITAARRGAGGAVAGVDVSLFDLSDRLPAGRPTASAFAAMLDRDGRVLAHGDTPLLRRIVEQGIRRSSPRTLSDDALPLAAVFGSPVLEALADRVARGDAMPRELEAENRRWRVAAAPAGQDVTFVMAAPVDELAAGPAETRRRLLVILGGGLLLCLPVLWGAALLVARPVERFARDAESLGRLDFAARPPVRTRVSELARLDDAMTAVRSALAERTERMRMLETAVSRLNDLVVITDAAAIDEPDGPRIVYVNDAFERRMGYDRDEVIGRTPRFLQAPDCPRDELDRIRAALREWKPVRAEVLNLTRAGEPVWLEIDIAPMAGQGGWFTHWVAVERDVTERRVFDERRRQSQKLEALGQLTGGVAHDFNNLLTVIIGNAQILAAERSDAGHAGQRENDQVREMLEMILAAAERGADLTARLLAFARRQTLSPVAVDVDALVAGMEGLLRRALAGRVSLELPSPDGGTTAFADPGQLEVAVLNLALNARDAMPDGGHITITTRMVDLDADAASATGGVPPGRYVRLSVHDTGSGMPPEVAARAFEPFFTTKEVGKGSGLGLSMVYGFAQQSQGHAVIESEPGTGTIVGLYLPAAPCGTGSARVTEADADVQGGDEHILVVEDDPLVSRHVAARLRALGYTVSSTGTAAEALDVLARTPDIRLVFSDVMLPGAKDGLDLAREVGWLRPDVPVLLTSGYTADAAFARGATAEGVRLLPKPYRDRDLARALRQLLDMPRPDRIRMKPARMET